MQRGRLIGGLVLVATVLLIIASLYYTRSLQQEREQTIAQLMSLPQYESCKYDASTCPQAVDSVVLPNATGVLLVIVAILLGIYLIRSDSTHRTILQELQTKRTQLGSDERRELLYSVLTKDERAIIEAVRTQPGISQATLRLRTDMSKAKLSMLLKNLEDRNLIKKIEDGKTNAVHLRREL